MAGFSSTSSDGLNVELEWANMGSDTFPFTSYKM